MNMPWKHGMDLWRSVLGDWGLRLDLVSDSPRSAKPGMWSEDASGWWLALDAEHALVVRGAAFPVNLQQALAWSFQAENAAADWRDMLLNRLHKLASSLPDDPDSVRGKPWLEERLQRAMAPKLPGCFAWLQIQHVGPNREREASWRDDVESVVQEFSPDSFLGWTDGTQVNSALLFERLDEDESSRLTGVSDGEELVVPPDWQRVVAVRDSLTDLLEVLASDAHVLGRISIGCVVNRTVQWQKGLATMVATRQLHEQIPQNRRVIAWGEEPLLQLFAGVPKHVGEDFLEAVGLQAPEGAFSLTSETVATLRGMIAANLNVSEAARMLYLHRNTLMSRIERIRQTTGYDIRQFRDAMILSAASALNRPQ